MPKNAKVQTNESEVNVLVETKGSKNRHYSHLDRGVNIIKVLTNDEIIELWENRKDKDNDKLQLAKDWIKKQEGYATSNCVDKTLNITFGSIVQYNK